MSRAVEELWDVARAMPHVDAGALARAIESAAREGGPLDYRTRLLLRDSVEALRSHWGAKRFARWLDDARLREPIDRATDPRVFDGDPSEVGFPSLTRRVVDVTNRETILEFFRSLSRHVREPTSLIVGGSIALMLGGLLARHTEDVDVVDEVPAELRDRHDLLEQLATRFGLQLAHFQSHYLPVGWETRVRSFQVFDRLDVRLVEPYDVMVSKLCSRRAKDLDDLRSLKARVDRDLLEARLATAGAALLAEPRAREAATDNWYVLFGDALPA